MQLRFLSLIPTISPGQGAPGFDPVGLTWVIYPSPCPTLASVLF